MNDYVCKGATPHLRKKSGKKLVEIPTSFCASTYDDRAFPESGIGTAGWKAARSFQGGKTGYIRPGLGI